MKNILDWIEENKQQFEGHEPRTMAQEPRNMELAKASDIPDAFDPDLEQSEFLRPGETLEDWKPNPFLKPHAIGGRVGYNDGQLVTPSVDGSRPGYYGKAEKLFTSNQQQKIINAFPDIKFDFTEDQKFGVQKYLESKKPGPDTRKVNKDYTKVVRFIKKGFKKDMGEGKTTRGTTYQKEGKRLSIKDQNKIKAKFDLPEGVKEWDFSKPDQKYGFKPDTLKKKNIAKRMAQTVADKNPWTLAADFGSTKGWMLAQMERVYKNEKKAPKTRPGVKKFTYTPIYEKINGVDRIIGFKDNTKAGGGKTYYGLNKYTKKKAGDWTNHGDWKLNQKLVDISKRSGNAPNKVITGLLKKRGFTGKVKLNDLIHFLSGTEGTSKERIKNAIVRHHESGVAFGSATNDLALTTQTINKRIVEAEKRIRANNILPDDIQLLKNNNVYVRHQGKLYGSGSKTAIGQFKQIESSVAKALETGKTFAGKDFTTKQLTKYLTQLCPKGQASGGRIGYKAAGAVAGTATVSCGKNRLNQILKSGNIEGLPDSEKNLVNKILKQGKNIFGATGRFALSALNPKSFMSLRALLGPEAAAFLGVWEGGVITNNVLRHNLPLGEALAKNWMTGWAKKNTLLEEQIENMRKNNFITTPGSGRAAQSIGLMEDVNRAYSDLDKIVVGGFDIPRIEAQKKQQAKIEELEKKYWDFVSSEEGMDEEQFEKDLTEYEARQGAGYHVPGEIQKDIFGYYVKGDPEANEPPIIRVNEVGYRKVAPFKKPELEPRAVKKGRGRGRGVIELDWSTPSYKTMKETPLSKEYMDAEQERIRKLGYIHPLGGELPQWYKDELQTEFRLKQAFNQPALRGTQFADGGRAGYMGGGIAAIRKPNALPPTGGPQSGGLPSLYNNVRKL